MRTRRRRKGRSTCSARLKSTYNNCIRIKCEFRGRLPRAHPQTKPKRRRRQHQHLHRQTQLFCDGQTQLLLLFEHEQFSDKAQSMPRCSIVWLLIFHVLSERSSDERARASEQFIYSKIWELNWNETSERETQFGCYRHSIWCASVPWTIWMPRAFYSKRLMNWTFQVPTTKLNGDESGTF